jgi:hypothetical protein
MARLGRNEQVWVMSLVEMCIEIGKRSFRSKSSGSGNGDLLWFIMDPATSKIYLTFFVVGERGHG